MEAAPHHHFAAPRLRGCVVAPTKIIAGLALCLGLRLLPAPGASGDYRSDLAAKAQAMAAAMAPDQPHDVRRCLMLMPI